jgi:tetratricopeptide (TPR) repeat protein
VKAPAILVAAAVLLGPFAARAEAPSSKVPVKARVLAERGRAFHDAGDYSRAIAAFTQAYVIAPSPALLFNLAQAYRLRGNCDDAALMYRRYLATNPNPEGRALAETHLASVESCLQKLGLHIPAETTTASVAVLPLPDLLAKPVPAPSHTAQIEKGIGIGLMLGGSVALALATYYGVQAHDAANEVEAAYARRAMWKDIAPIDARGKAAATHAQISVVGGALGIAGGVVMYLIGKHTAQTSMTVAPTTGRGVEVGMSWAF